MQAACIVVLYSAFPGDPLRHSAMIRFVEKKSFTTAPTPLEHPTTGRYYAEFLIRADVHFCVESRDCPKPCTCSLPRHKNEGAPGPRSLINLARVLFRGASEKVSSEGECQVVHMPTDLEEAGAEVARHAIGQTCRLWG